MKTLLYFSFLSFFALTLSSCKQHVDPMEHSIFTISKTLTIDHSSTGSVASDTVRFWDVVPSFMQNRNSVEDLKLDAITCTIVDDRNGMPQQVSGSLRIGNTKGGQLREIASIRAANGSMMMDRGHMMEMHNDGMGMMMNMMMHDDAMMLSFMCDSTTRDSMHFTMQFDFRMSAGCSCMD